jgi:hypothetical protein
MAAALGFLPDRIPIQSRSWLLGFQALFGDPVAGLFYQR